MLALLLLNCLLLLNSATPYPLSSSKKLTNDCLWLYPAIHLNHSLACFLASISVFTIFTKSSFSFFIKYWSAAISFNNFINRIAFSRCSDLVSQLFFFHLFKVSTGSLIQKPCSLDLYESLYNSN